MKFLHLHLPATNDDGTKAFFRDGYAGLTHFFEAYPALWEARYPRAKLDEIFQVIHNYYRCAQYDLVPGMGDLTYFKMDNIPRWDSPQVEAWWLGADPANTATAAGAETAYVAVGIFGTSLKVIGARSGRWHSDQMVAELEGFVGDMFRLTGLPPWKILVERAAGGYQLLDRVAGALPIVPRGSKEDRVADICFLVNQGRVQFPAQPSRGVANLEKQMRDFPLCGLKDLVDAFTHCLKLTQSPEEFKFELSHQTVTYDALDEFKPANDWDTIEDPNTPYFNVF